MAGILRPEDLNQISSDAEMEKIEEARKRKQMKEKQELELGEAFKSREVHPDAINRINNAVSAAAKLGLHKIQVVTFPSSFCTDGGRRINIADPEWPSTLTGFAKQAFEFYQKELHPLGFKCQAEIISFPDGMPGDVGLFLKW
jgi:hypothetical protein